MAIQIRRGTDSGWESNNSNIVAGEPAVTTDTGRFFVGTDTGEFVEMVNIDTIAPAYDSSVTYNVGDYCVEQGNLYVCNTANTTGTWDSSKWTKITIKQALDDIVATSVPTSVREAIYTLLNASAYAQTGLDDEIAIVESWAGETTSLTLSSSSISLNADTLQQTLTAMVIPSSATVSWSSSDTSVATVSGGVVSAISNGSCVISAVAGNLTATCAVTVSGITLQSISATYTQTQYVFTDTPLDDLKTDLIVTGLYSSGVTAEVDSENYTLSGTLAVGTSTITVTCGEVTTTFTTTVTQTYQVATYPYTFVPSASWAGSWDSSTQTGQVRGAGASSYPGLILQGLQYKFSVVKTMHLRVKITITLSDTIVDEAGMLFNLGLFDKVNPTNAGADRKASKVPFKQMSASTIVWERIYALSEQFTGTGLDNYYLGLALLFNAPNSASVTASFSNISLEVF